MKKAADAIMDCLNEQKMTQTQLAAAMGEDVRLINQQLNRQNDFKVERFLDVLAYIGYRVELVPNDGIRKVTPEYGQEVINNRSPHGLFWYSSGDAYIGIDNMDGEAIVKGFSEREDCFEWLKK